MPLLSVIRHGPTAWTSEKRIQGRTDTPLSLEGRAMVATWKLPEQLSDAYWEVSPLRRTRQTAELLGGANLHAQPRLIEMNWGDWEGQRRADLLAAHAIDVTRAEANGMAFRAPGGETPLQVAARLRPWLAAVGKRQRATFAVTHKGVIRVLLALATGWNMTGRPPAKVRFGALQVFYISPTGQIVPVALEVSCGPR